MSADVQSLKASLDCRDIARETDDLDSNDKMLCRFHDEKTPSLQIFKDGYFCFGCRVHGDAVDWLKHIHNLSTAEAIKELERRAGGYVPPVAERPVKLNRPAPKSKPLDPRIIEAHNRRADQLDHVPAALEGRGFTLGDLRRLQIAAYGQDAVFPIPGPDGCVLALKRRYAKPRESGRYLYTTPKRGTPAWCSPNFGKPETVLIVEGELNGMACWLAAPELAVMGTAGSSDKGLHLDALKGRTVYVYGDGDEPGQKARDTWAHKALSAGAAGVFVVEPWPADACDLAGREGRAALRERLV